MPAEDMPAFVCDHGIELLLRQQLDQPRSDGDEDLRIARGPRIGLRVHLEIELGLLDAEFFADRGQPVVQFGQLRRRQPDRRRHVDAVKQPLGAQRQELPDQRGKSRNVFHLLQSGSIFRMNEIGRVNHIDNSFYSVSSRSGHMAAAHARRPRGRRSGFTETASSPASFRSGDNRTDRERRTRRIRRPGPNPRLRFSGAAPHGGACRSAG